MALDGGFDLGVIAEKLRGLAESVTGIGTDVGFIEVKVGVLYVPQEQFVDRGSWRWRRRRRWRLRYGDADAGVRGATGTAGGNCVCRGIRRSDFGGTLRRDGAHSRCNGELGGVGGSPTQSRGITRIDGRWVGLQR